MKISRAKNFKAGGGGGGEVTLQPFPTWLDSSRDGELPGPPSSLWAQHRGQWEGVSQGNLPREPGLGGRGPSRASEPCSSGLGSGFEPLGLRLPFPSVQKDAPPGCWTLGVRPHRCGGSPQTGSDGDDLTSAHPSGYPIGRPGTGVSLTRWPLGHDRCRSCSCLFEVIFVPA